MTMWIDLTVNPFPKRKGTFVGVVFKESVAPSPLLLEMGQG